MRGHLATLLAYTATFIVVRSFALPAQDRQNPQQPPVFRGAADFVYVDVYPRRNGRLVDGLRVEDFQIFEDGKPQVIKSFEFIRSEPNVPDAARRDPNTKYEGDRLAADPHNRVFVVYLDAYHTTFFGGHDTRRPLIDFLDRTIGTNDLFGVMVPETSVSQLVFGRRTNTIEAELTRHFTWPSGDDIDRGTVFPRTEDERRLRNCLNPRDLTFGDRLVLLERENLLMTSLEELMIRLRDLRDERKNVVFISEGWIPRPPQIELLGNTTGDPPPVRVDPRGGRLGIGVAQPGEPETSWCNAQITRLAMIDFEHEEHEGHEGFCRKTFMVFTVFMVRG